MRYIYEKNNQSVPEEEFVFDNEPFEEEFDFDQSGDKKEKKHKKEKRSATSDCR